MGLLGKVTKFVASDAINEAVDKAINVIDKIEKKIPEPKEKPVVKNLEPGKKAMLIKQDEYNWNDQFYVYDNNWKIKYKVEGKLTSITNKLKIYDVNNKEVASIQKKIFKIRLDAMFFPVTDFIFKINGEKVGTLKQKGTFLSTKFTFSNGWKINNKKFSLWKYQIKENEKIIADISSDHYDTFVTKYDENINELLILMVVLALGIESIPKGTHFKRVYNNRKPGFMKNL